MHGNLPVSGGNANGSTAKVFTKNGSDTWFEDACSQLFDKSDVGLALHIATGVADRTCYRYAAEGLPQGGNFLRALLRSDGGYTWLAVIMEGADAQWWRELDAARDLTIKYRIERR